MQTCRRTHQIEMKNPPARAVGMLCAAALLIPALTAHSQAPSAQDYLIRTVDPVAEDRDIQFTFVNNSGMIVEQLPKPRGRAVPLGPAPGSVGGRRLERAQGARSRLDSSLRRELGGAGSHDLRAGGRCDPDGRLQRICGTGGGP